MTATTSAATCLVRVDPRTDPLWAALAGGDGGSLFTSPPWIGAVCDIYGFRPTARVAVDPSGRPLGGVAWVDVDDLRGRRRLALPFCDRADPIVADADAWRLVSGDALAGDRPFTLRCLEGSRATADPRLTVVGEAAWHTTSLDRHLVDLHAALRPRTRRNIATARRSGVEVVLRDDEEAMATYHRLHVGLRKRKYRLLAQPLEFFERIRAAFAPSGALCTALALVDGVPVAGAVYLVWGDTVYYKFGASRAEFLPLRPNDAVHWRVLRWAHERGLRTLDWGLSDLDQPGLCAYKSNWASREGRIRTLTGGGLHQGAPAEVGQLLGVVTDLLTDPSVPDAVSARAGAALYRYFC
jgi:CelD/BcsL family acetyltransferase involved in cellulose biosynthesis